MKYWWVGTVIGAISLVMLNTYERVHHITDLRSHLFVVPLLIIMNLSFWSGFLYAPSFIQAWFIGSAMCAVGAWLAHLFILKEPICLMHIVGFVLVFAGAFLLARN